MTNIRSVHSTDHLRGAWRVTGPIDAFINTALNSAIPWFFLRDVDSLPLWEFPSAYTFFGPMVACVLLFTVLSGYRNGTIWSRPMSATTRSWLMPGAALGMLSAGVGSLVFLGALIVLARGAPEPLLSSTSVILTNGLMAGLLGYAGQVAGVFVACRRESNPSSDITPS